jgi:hypothetical protein
VVATDERRYEPAAPRTPDELLRDAWAIRHLLDDLAPDEHDVRIRLIVARDRLRLEAAQQWRDHGWRAITDEF